MSREKNTGPIWAAQSLLQVRSVVLACTRMCCSLHCSTEQCDNRTIAAYIRCLYIVDRRLRRSWRLTELITVFLMSGWYGSCVGGVTFRMRLSDSWQCHG